MNRKTFLAYLGALVAAAIWSKSKGGTSVSLHASSNVHPHATGTNCEIVKIGKDEWKVKENTKSNPIWTTSSQQ